MFTKEYNIFYLSTIFPLDIASMIYDCLTQIRYHETYNLNVYSPMIGFIKHGIEKSYDKITGNLIEIKPYCNGKIHGLNIRYFFTPKNQLNYIMPYVHGVKHGIEKHYRYGKIESSISIKNGELHGECMIYSDGKVQYKALYENGKEKQVNGLHDGL